MLPKGLARFLYSEINPFGRRPRTLALTKGKTRPNASISVNWTKDDSDDEDTKKPSETLGITGFLLVDDIGLEPTTPTMSTWCSNQLS